MINKKGAITDLIIFIVASFLLLSCVGILWAIFSQTSNQVVEQLPNIEPHIKSMNITQMGTEIMGKTIASYDVLSWVTIIIIVGMILNIIISSALIKTYPFVFVPYVFMTVVAVIISAVVSNTYEQLILNPSIASGFAGLLTASWFMLQLPFIVTVVGFIAGIFLFINIDWGI